MSNIERDESNSDLMKRSPLTLIRSGDPIGNIPPEAPKEISSQTPVVVLKLEHYGSLGIMRTLGRMGIRVYGVDKNASATAFASRYCSGCFVWDIDGAPHEESVATLLSLSESLGGQCILIPTCDETVKFVAAQSERLRAAFMFPRQSFALVDTLSNKKKMFFLAQEHGVPVPKSGFPESRKELEEMLPSILFPAVLKGIDGGLLARRTGRKMVIVRNEDELVARYEEMELRDEPNLMIQEYIPGDDDSAWLFNGYFDRSSDCLFSQTGRKIRQNPVYTGMTSLGVCSENHSVSSMTRRFMKGIGYRGIVDVDYRFDRRDGLYKILDVNPRIGATFRLFVGRKGMDVARAMYLDLTHQSVDPDQIVEGRKWLVEDKDLKSSYYYLLDRRLSLIGWLRSLVGIGELGYFASDDVRPFLHVWKNHLFRKLGFDHGESGSNKISVAMRRRALMENLRQSHQEHEQHQENTNPK